jgi:hypothetical protein
MVLSLRNFNIDDSMDQMTGVEFHKVIFFDCIWTVIQSEKYPLCKSQVTSLVVKLYLFSEYYIFAT